MLRPIKSSTADRSTALETAKGGRAGGRAGADLVGFEGYVLDRLRRRLCRRDGTIVRIITGEFKLIVALISYPGEPLSRARLMGLVYGRAA